MNQTNDFFNKNMEALRFFSPNLFNLINCVSKNEENATDATDDARNESDANCYGETIFAKNGEKIPAFLNKKAMYSLYNPQKEAENFFPSFSEKENCRFVTVLGLGNGKAIEMELQKGKSRILAIEKNANSVKKLFCDFDFCNIFKNGNFRLCTNENLQETLCNFYLPQLHGNFLQLQNRVWVQHNLEITEKINENIKAALKKISADFSVQAHFAKIWKRNILENLEILSVSKNCATFDFSKKKYASIIAAGPSLDKSIKNLYQNRSENCIIATDTAFPILVKQKIIPDFVITIDGQNISYRHFFEKTNSTIFIIDLCAMPSVAQNCLKNKNSVIFTQNSHPFLQLVNEYFE